MERLSFLVLCALPNERRADGIETCLAENKPRLVLELQVELFQRRMMYYFEIKLQLCIQVFYILPRFLSIVALL